MILIKKCNFQYKTHQFPCIFPQDNHFEVILERNLWTSVKWVTNPSLKFLKIFKISLFKINSAYFQNFLRIGRISRTSTFPSFAHFYWKIQRKACNRNWNNQTDKLFKLVFIQNYSANWNISSWTYQGVRIKKTDITPKTGITRVFKLVLARWRS